MPDCQCHGTKCRLDADDPRHGTVNGYSNLGCRCPPCNDANSDYSMFGAGNRAKWKYRARLAAEGRNTGAPSKKRTKPYQPRANRGRLKRLDRAPDPQQPEIPQEGSTNE